VTVVTLTSEAMNERVFLKQVEGKPAPMPLLGVQAFANTLDVEEGIDRLDSLASWREWLEESDLIAPGIRLRSEHLREARAMRDLIRELLTANADEPDGGRDTGRIAEQLGIRRMALTIGPEGELVVDLAPARDPRWLSSQLVGIVHDAQLTGTWSRLKLCRNDDCSWAFYDSSRNRSGSWCRMGECGNRLKNRAYRARQRAERS
jgi:predicted RNA-binding Zn ribbon-like protein